MVIYMLLACGQSEALPCYSENTNGHVISDIGLPESKQKIWIRGAMINPKTTNCAAQSSIEFLLITHFPRHGLKFLNRK